MEKKMLWLLIQKGLVGMAAIIISILLCMSIYNEWEITPNIFIICIIMCFALIDHYHVFCLDWTHNIF